MSRWFRLYDDLVDDPKIQRLPGDMVKSLLNLWCLASQNDGRLPALDDIAFKLRMKPAKVEVLLSVLGECGLIDSDEAGLRPHNWNARQFKSDVADPTAASRQKAYRDRLKNRNAAVTVTDTRAETEQITETDKSRETRAPRATRLPNDWVPAENDLAFAASKGLPSERINTEALKFLNYWTSKSGQGATKTDWSKTWQNWILTATQGIPTNGRRTVHDAANDLLATLKSFDDPAPDLRSIESQAAVRLLPSR